MYKLTKENLLNCSNTSGIYHISVGRHHYVGSSIAIRSRLKTHIWSMVNNKHRNRIIQNCFNKYTLDNFYFEILEYCSAAERIMREKYYIEKLHPDLNVTDPVTLKRDKVFSQHLSTAMRKYYATHTSAACIPVYQYSLSGSYITSYSSATHAAKLFKVEVSAIVSATNGRSKTCKGFQWRKEKLEKIESLVKEKPCRIKPQVPPKPGNKRKIHRYSYNGSYIDTFESASLADRTLGIHGCNAAARSNTNYKSVGGFLWSYNKVDKLPPYENHSKDAKKRPISITDVRTNTIYDFDSIAAAAKTLFPTIQKFDSLCATISSCANGKCKTFNKHYTACYK